MSNYNNILVAIDINAEHDKVIQKALSISSSADILNLVYIPMPLVYIQPYLYGLDYSDINDDDRLESARKKLTSIAEKHGISANKVHLKVGDAGNEIKQIANEIHADLIVIGTHGKSGLKLLLGSTANSVLHGVKQDVLAVRIHE